MACVWKGMLVFGNGRELYFHLQPKDKIGKKKNWTADTSADVVNLCVVPGKNGDQERFLAVAFADLSIRWYQLKENEQGEYFLKKAHTVKAHTGRICSLICHKGITYSGSGGTDGSIKSWKAPDKLALIEQPVLTGQQPLPPKKENALLLTFNGHIDDVHSMIIFRDVYLISASGSDDKTIRVWNITNATCIQAFIAPHNTIRVLYNYNDEVILSGGDSKDRKLCIWGAELFRTSVSLAKCSIQ